jgi:undecaprenyl-diphosphatase
MKLLKESSLMNDIIWAIYYFLAVIVLGLIIEMFSLNDIESIIVSRIQDIFVHALPIQIFVTITYLGDLRFLIAISLLHFVYSYYKSRGISKSIRLLVFLALVTLFTYFLKELFSRERPHLYSWNIISYTDDRDFSFPSGHVSRSLGAYSIILNSTKIWKKIILFVLVTLISLSRIVLGAHYFTDVVGALFLSLFIERLINISLNILCSKFKTVLEKM